MVRVAGPQLLMPCFSHLTALKVTEAGGSTRVMGVGVGAGVAV